MSEETLSQDSQLNLINPQLELILETAGISSWIHDLEYSSVTLFGDIAKRIEWVTANPYSVGAFYDKIFVGDDQEIYTDAVDTLLTSENKKITIECRIKQGSDILQRVSICAAILEKNPTGAASKIFCSLEIPAGNATFTELNHEEELRRHDAELDRKYRLHSEELEEANIELHKAKRMAEVALNTAENFAREQITALELSETLRMEADKSRQEALDMADKAKQADKSKSEFLANMSHEIRTPMNAIMGMAAMLSKTELDQMQLKQVRTISTSARALLTILNDILDASQIEAGKLRINNEPFTVKTLCDDIIEMMKPIANEKSLELLLDFNVSKGSKRLGDTVRIRQTLINLINNSLKFTEAGTVTVTIFDININNTECIEFRVKDTGIGMNSEECSMVFNKFAQTAHHMTRKYGGVGLGLSICKELIHLMNGEINVVSEAGVGSTFYFYIPLKILDDDFVTSKFEEMPLDQIIANVLLVEDNLVNQEVSIMLLEDMGCHVDIACNGEEAVKFTKIKKFDAILMDLQMPIMDGHRATEIIRTTQNINKETPIAALTGHATEEAKKTCFELGMDGYLTKPLEPMELRSCLIKILDRNKNSGPEKTSNNNKPKKNTIEHNYLQGKTVLIAEDDQTVLRMLQTAFNAKGMKTIPCENGIDALEKFKLHKSHIDLVATDMRMPGLGGGELCDRIFKISPQQKVIIISGHYDDTRVNELFTSGKAHFLKKPFSLAEFGQTLKDLFYEEEKSAITKV